MNIAFLDIAYPGRPRHPRFPRRVIDTVEQVKKEVADTAVQVKDAAKDSVAQLQDFVTGGNSGSDDNTKTLVPTTTLCCFGPSSWCLQLCCSASGLHIAIGKD